MQQAGKKISVETASGQKIGNPIGKITKVKTGLGYGLSGRTPTKPGSGGGGQLNVD
jgi:hypothetical protein